MLGSRYFRLRYVLFWLAPGCLGWEWAALGYCHRLQTELVVKETVARDFLTLVFTSINPTWVSNSDPKIFSNSDSFSPNYSSSKFDWPLYIIAASDNKIVD
jgi:hypothetical protein